MPAAADIRVLLFDLGGVLLELRDPIETFGLSMEAAEFKAIWLASPSVREFERGAVDTEQFAKNIVVEAGLPYGWREFIERFDSWPERLFERTLPVLRSIPGQYRRALLSNINALHWGRREIAAPLSGCFDRLFLSYRTGHVKPDRAGFEQVVAAYACRPDEVLFLDDSEDNVAGAAAYGMQAVHTIGIDAVEQVLRERGVLD